MKNRHGQDVELSVITRVEFSDNGVEIDRDPGWGTMWIGLDELDGFEPKVGDAIVTFTTNLSMIHGIIIENKVIRYKTAAQVERDRKVMLDGFRLDKLERYVEHGEALKKRAKNLHPALAARMQRFADKSGVEFWIDSAPYEMAVMEGAQALLNKVEGPVPSINGRGTKILRTTEHKVAWINEWWDINSDKHDPPYDYKKQMEIVPDFGDGHSGNTAAAARAMAIRVLEGKEV